MDFFDAQDTILCYKYASEDSLWKLSKISNNFKHNFDETDLKQPKNP